MVNVGKRLLLLSFFTLLSLSTEAYSQERVVLDAPVRTIPPPVFEYQVTMVHLDRESEEVIVRLRQSIGGEIVPDGEFITIRWDRNEARRLIRRLNKMDFSTVTLENRLLKVAQRDGLLPSGAVVGQAEEEPPH